MFTPQGPLNVYTDGAYDAATGARAYGWVSPEAPAHWTRTRVVVEEPKRGPSQSSAMESAAIIDAISEHAHRGVKLILHADDQYLAQLVEKYRRGEVTSEAFFEKPLALREQDAQRLLKLMKLVDFEIRWVKGHGACFENLIIDNALRVAAYEGGGDQAGCAYVLDAMASGEAVVWGKYCADVKHKRYRTGFTRVSRASLVA